MRACDATEWSVQCMVYDDCDDGSGDAWFVLGKSDRGYVGMNE